jgi:hypothetical protein
MTPDAFAETIAILGRIGTREGATDDDVAWPGWCTRYPSPMSESEPDSPDEAEHLAGTITRLRGEYFRLQQMIRDHRSTNPGDEQTRESAEEDLDRLIEVIKFSSGALAGYCAQTAHEGTFTAREARLILIATGAGDQALTSLRERPEEMTEALRAFITNPLPLEDKLRMIAESQASAQ